MPSWQLINRMALFAAFCSIAESAPACANRAEPCPAEGVDVPESITFTSAVDGTRICDAYVTRDNESFCSWRGCVCEPPPPGHSSGTIVVSRAGYAVATHNLPSPVTIGACDPLPPPTNFVLMPAAVTEACVPRDASFCADHRTCYAMPPLGCTITTEKSSDPGSTYVCCTP